MSELGIFIDESGIIEADTSKKSILSDFYIVSFLFHDKSIDINFEVEQFEDFLFRNGFEKNLPIHAMPLIRQQKPYSKLSRDERRKLFFHLFQFMRRLKLKHKVFVCNKNYCSSKQTLRQNLENDIKKMILNNLEYFKKYDEIVIYYDEGQAYLSKILRNAFSESLNNYRFKEMVSQCDYRLLQCSDMVCSLELINQRKQNNEHIKSIEKFFISENKYNKNYNKAYKNLEL